MSDPDLTGSHVQRKYGSAVSSPIRQLMSLTSAGATQGQEMEMIECDLSLTHSTGVYLGCSMKGNKCLL